MLQKYQFTLKCLRSGVVYGFGGSEVHGLLFAIMGEIDKDYATDLHGLIDKPFVLELCMDNWERDGRISRCQTGETYTITLSCLNKELAERVSKANEVWAGREVRLGSAIFSIDEIRLIGQLFYQDILTNLYLSHEFTMQFNTPTSFRRQGVQILFPEPVKVYENLLRRWSIFSPIKLLDEIDFSRIMVKKYNLRTEVVHFENYMIAGFVGKCTYKLPEDVEDLLLLHVGALSRFAIFSGVGYKVTMGMGNISYQAS